MSDYEKLGAFYLGRVFDPAAGALTPDLLMYDAKDLTTHGVIVGMTGSGKTGLAVGLIEEAAIDGVPTIAIDPKGDLGNLLLAFPRLSAEDFRPWVDEAEALRKGMTPEAYAADTAARWRKGLADWGQDPSRIARYRDAADLAIYTPGSSAGLPLTILKSFSAPPAAVREDEEALRERVVSTTSGLLALLGVDADPVRSREHILVANLLDHAWRAGRDLDLAALIREIQSPPFARLGVFDLDSFYPSKERFSLAAALNGLVASPGFGAWTQGEPLDVARLLWTSTGRPRVSVVSIAHLNDAERMFFVTALLNEVLAWTRAQSGTSSLRAILYMDEVFGYFPPTANPPSKTPMLTLLKQARAFGLGVVLATQNPVDLDYKGLGNAGTWFLGRLQTERDKARVLDGLEGASAAAGAFDRSRLDTTLSGLRSRTFLMVNAHDDAPSLFQTRWTLSYLRGPLTRPQIQALAAPSKAAARQAATADAPRADGVGPAGPAAPASPAAPSVVVPAAGARPVLPPDVREAFFPVGPAWGGRRLEYRPTVLSSARVHYVDSKLALDRWEQVGVWAGLPNDPAADPWEGAQVFDGEPVLEAAPVQGAAFAPLPSAAAQPKAYARWQKSLAEWIYRTRPHRALRCPSLDLSSRPGEPERDFRARLAHAAREKRDLDVEALRRKFAPRAQALEARLRAAEDRVARERAQASHEKVSSALSWGAAILGAVLGGRRTAAGNAGRAASAARSASRARKEAGEVVRAEESVEVLRKNMADLEAEVQAAAAAIHEATEPERLAVEEVRVAPRKGDLAPGPVRLVWTPHALGADGSSQPAW